MTIYEYFCKDEKKKGCKNEMTVVRKVEDRDKSFFCICGSKVEKKASVNARPKVLGGTPRFH